jgi:murein DD-endopeptidase MepM/ murein hydrolase activator NlpD
MHRNRLLRGVHRWRAIGAAAAPSIATMFEMLLVFVAFANASGQAASTGQTQVAKIRALQIDAWVRPSVGQFVPADDLTQYLVYDLYVTNWNAPPALRFAAVDVEDAATGKRLARLDTVALETPSTLRITPYPGSRPGPANRLFPAGRTAIIRMEVKLPLGASVPHAVRHRIAFESDPNLQLLEDDGSLSSELVAFSESMPIDRARPIAIGPPLLGGPWYCSNGIGAFGGHEWIGASERTARMFATSRFGCDWSRAGAASDINSYGADVIAVADGRVVKAQDDVPENVRQDGGGSVMPVPLTNKTIPGNWIVLEIGKDRYAYYAHLQLGSLRVKVGDRVRKGQLLAKVGNSGNATGPHLHFHVCNGPGQSTCDAVPYVITSYSLSGRLMWNPQRTRKVEFQVPTTGSIATFSGPGDFGPLRLASKDPDWSAHDTVAQQYPMERSPRIRITGYPHPIVISSAPTRTANVKIRRSAGSRQELDCFQTRIDHRPDLITISYVHVADRPGCGSAGSRHALALEVPSDAHLELSNIYYSTVKITGPVQGLIAENVGGHVSIAAAGTVNLRNLGNGVSLRLGPTGPMTIESVFGDVELDVAGRQDVEIRASSLVGEIRSVPSDFVRVKTDDGYVLKSRAGGTPISLKRIDGDIVLKRQ